MKLQQHLIWFEFEMVLKDVCGTELLLEAVWRGTAK
jgi:hypothetical protein